jgi:hypothetical protein
MEDAHGGAAPAHCIVRNAECAPCIASTAALPINLHALTHTHRHMCTHTHARTLATLPGHTIPSAAWQTGEGAVRCPAQSTTRAYCVRSHTVRGVPDGSLPVSTAFDSIRCQQSTASTCPSQRGPNASRATTPCRAGLHERNMPQGIPGRPYSTTSHTARFMVVHMVAHAACDTRHAWRREYWHGGADQRRT